MSWCITRLAEGAKQQPQGVGFPKAKPGRKLRRGPFMSHGKVLSLRDSVIVWVPATFFAWILAVGIVLLRAESEVG